MRGLEGWRQLVAGAVRVKSPEDVDRIAAMCAAAEAVGENCGVWHQSAIFYAFADRCPCAPCEALRKKVSEALVESGR
jgi:hypothetical protein